jgi:hypothetical protein
MIFIITTGATEALSLALREVFGNEADGLLDGRVTSGIMSLLTELRI